MMEDDIEDIRQEYAKTLEEILSDPELSANPTFNRPNCIKIISDTFARAETNNLFYSVSRYGMLSALGKLSSMDELWYNRHLISMNLIDSTTMEEKKQFDEHIGYIQQLCKESIKKAGTAKEALKKFGRDETISINFYIRDISDICVNTLTYVKIIKKMNERLIEKVQSEYEREMEKNVKWASHYSPDQIMNLRMSAYLGSVNRLIKGLEKREEAEVITAIKSIANSNTTIRLKSKAPAGSGELRSVLYFIKETMPEQYNFFRYCIKLVINQNKAQ